MGEIELTTEVMRSSIRDDAEAIRKATSWKALQEAIAFSYEKTMDSIIESRSNQISDLCAEVDSLRERLEQEQVRRIKAEEQLADMEKRTDTVAVKASRRDMAAKMEAAVTNVKILDLDFDKNTDDRKEMVHAAKERLRAKIRGADQQQLFSDLTKKADVQVLARRTVKRKRRSDGQEIWTAPVVLSIKDKDDRWEMEDLLRKNQIYPTFHWPKEFLDPLKKMREELKARVDEESTFVRIRPVQNDGKWKIRADVKPKQGDGRFTTKATWEMPPLEEALRRTVKDWHKPTWADIARRNSVANIVANIHASSANAASRPSLQVEGAGAYEIMDL